MVDLGINSWTSRTIMSVLSTNLSLLNMKVLILVLAAVSLCTADLREEGPGCRAPNGGGLEPVLEEFVALIPTEQILEVFLIALTSDPETQSVMEFLSSDEFLRIVNSVGATPAFDSLVTFACNELYFDAIYYVNILAGILGFPEIESRSVLQRSSGFNAMLHEILALLPVDELQSLLEQKLATDYYLQLAFQKINSDEFGIIIETLQSNVAYNNMKDRLRGLGIDVDDIISTINKIFKPLL